MKKFGAKFGITRDSLVHDMKALGIIRWYSFLDFIGTPVASNYDQSLFGNGQKTSNKWCFSHISYSPLSEVFS
jgi:hypothetical protein